MWRTDHILGYIYAEILEIQKGLQTFKHHLIYNALVT